MDLKKFMILTRCGTLIRTALWSLVGYFFGQHQSLILSYIQSYESYAKYALVVAVIVFIVWIVNRSDD